LASGKRIQAPATGHKPSPLLAALFGLLLILSSAPARAEQLQAVSEDSLNLTFLMLQKLSGAAAAGADPYSNGGEDGPRLISRQLLFGIPERVGVQISPDGNWLSYLSAESGFFNIWIAPVNRLPAASEGGWTLKPDLSSARPVTNETIRGIESYFWADTGRHIIFSLDTFGDENWHIYSLDIETG